MALASAPPVFAYCSHNYASTPVAAPGTNFTAGASGADAAAVTILSALAHDAHFVRLRFNGVQSSGVDSTTAGDLLIDPAGGTSWSPIVNDLVCGFLQSTNNGGQQAYEFPIFIPSGATVGFRAKTTAGADITAGQVVIEAYGEPARPEMWWCGSGVETLGISDAKGTSITPGNSGAAGSWTSVGSTSTRTYKYAHLGVNGSDATALAAVYHVEIGAGSQKLPGSSITYMQLSTSEAGYRIWPGMVACNIPSGTQMQARATCSTTAENIFVAIYGVY